MAPVALAWRSSRIQKLNPDRLPETERRARLHRVYRRPEEFQVYLDEFVFRHNRRRLPMAAFQTLLGLGTGRKPTAYNEIRGAADLSAPDPKLLGSAETTV